jgi:ABC-2 type transport system permease protein
MRAIWNIARREVLTFFVSPIAYVVATVWLLYFGIVFYLLALFFSTQPPGSGQSLLGAFFGGTTLFYLPLLIFAPVLTMRLLAEEKNSGTLEALMTAPVSDTQIVLGKYLAAMFFWVVLWAPTALYVWIASGTATDVVDVGVLGATYLGILCIGLFYMGVGLFMSAVARSQIVAAMLTFLVLGGLFVIGLAGYATLDDQKRAIFEYLGLWTQMESFARGIVDTRFLVYDVSAAALTVFLATRAVQAQRWE